MPSHPVIAVTAGDPCGIGPEVILKALATFRVPPRVRLAVIGDHAVFAQAARCLRRPLPAWPVLRSNDPWPLDRDGARVVFLDCGHTGSWTPGQPARGAGRAALGYLERAVALWRQRRIHGLVTAPVTKWAMALHHPGFVGQTEYLAAATARRDVVMMFVSDRLRVVLLTRHLPLHQVAAAVDRRLLRMTARLTAQALRILFGLPRPTLAFCGLNPHAGEAGRCGGEEQAVMRPVIRSLRREGIACEGPFAADGFFAGLGLIGDGAGRRRGRYDAVVCAYHDQGLIPFKLVARDRGCQLTIGLPLVRTSPDHGSALDLAGRGRADPGSMRYAVGLAVRLYGKAVTGASPRPPSPNAE